jgi:hypothetical protein
MSGDLASEKEYPSIKKGSDCVGNPNEAGLQDEQSNEGSRTLHNPSLQTAFIRESHLSYLDSMSLEEHMFPCVF